MKSIFPMVSSSSRRWFSSKFPMKPTLPAPISPLEKFQTSQHVRFYTKSTRSYNTVNPSPSVSITSEENSNSLLSRILESKAVDLLWNVGKNQSPKYLHEMSCINSLMKDIQYIESIDMNSSAYSTLYDISSLLKKQLTVAENIQKRSLLEKFQLLDEYIKIELEQYQCNQIEPKDSPTTIQSSLSDIEKQEIERKKAIYFRLEMMKTYLQSLEKAIKNKDISDEMCQKIQDVSYWRRFLDCLLLGTSSERVKGKFFQLELC